jgi:hypothetical protein
MRSFQIGLNLTRIDLGCVMSGSHVENGHLFHLLGQMGKQHIVKVVDEVVETAAWS